MASSMRVSWGGGNELHASHIGEFGGRVARIHVSEQWDAQRRRVAYESLPAFALLHNQRQIAHNHADWWEHVLEYSRSISNVFDKASLIKAIWELVEVFYVDRTVASWLPERLADWLQDYDQVLSGEASTIHSILISLERDLPGVQFPEDDPAYWDAMASALSIGWLDIVISFLRMHGSYRLDQLDDRQTENGLVEAVTQLIAKMPRLRPRLLDGAPGVAISFKPDFAKTWGKWRSQVSKLENSIFWGECTHRGTFVGLKKLIQVLLGNVDVLVLSTYHWMELLVAHFIYVMPFSLVSDGMRTVASKCKQLKASGEQDLRELLTAIISNDTEILLAKCSNVFDSWMMAHVGDLVVAKGDDARAVVEEEREVLGGLCFGEVYRLVYAQVLSSHSLTWQLAPVYLASCTKQGLGMLEALVLRQPCGSQKLALKAMEICRLYELDVVGVAIARAVGLHHLKHGQQSVGIVWLQRARDEDRLSAIADECLAKRTSGESDDLQGLEFFEDAPSTRHEGLSRYKNFKAAVQNIRDLRRREPYSEKLTALGRVAVSDLLQLVKAGTFPQRFWLPLLQDSVELIEWPEHVLISETETGALLCCLEEVFLAKDRGDLDAQHPLQIVVRVRLALAWNLGRAILQR